MTSDSRRPNAGEKTVQTEGLECIGDPGDRHAAVYITPKKSQGEWHWTCPKCGWLMKKYLGETVTEYV